MEDWSETYPRFRRGEVFLKCIRRIEEGRMTNWKTELFNDKDTKVTKEALRRKTGR